MTDKINGRTPDEIKEGLRCCLKEDANHDCPTCPYLGDRKNYNCSDLLIADMFAYNRQLERERDRIKAVRDAAVKDIEDAAPCFACIHFERNGGDCIGARVCVDDVLQEALGGKYADYHFEWRGAVHDVLDAIREAKAVDAVEVVRCKDCKHWGTGYGGETECIKVCEFANYMVGKNGYCVYGERKMDAEVEG